jgi:hypothetical protein
MQVNQEVKRINRGLKIKRVMEESSIASEDLIIEVRIAKKGESMQVWKCLTKYFTVHRGAIS